VRDLVRAAGVSAVTLRRDLDALERLGRVRREHGRAVLSEENAPRFAPGETTAASAKRRIGAAAAELIRPGMLVGLDTGTTTLEIARALVRRLGRAAGREELVRIVTNSLPAAATLQPCEGVEVILAGGVLRRSTPDVTGPLAADVLGRFRTDLAFLGADSLDRAGVYVDDVTVINTAVALLEQTERGYLVADGGKFGRQGRVRYAEWPRFHGWVTDVRPPARVDVKHIVVAGGGERGDG
jgi:DeoR/GlpR family transcriptional regulator of sugar metabolism